jgi:O-antigen ligase
MKEFFLINDSTENRITYVHLLLFLISLPFDRFYSELFLISLFIHTCIQLKKKNFLNISYKPLVLMQSVYLLTMAGTIYTMHPNIAFGLWEKQLAIILFPILFLLNPIDLKKYRGQLLYSFALVNVIVLLYLYYDAFSIIRYYKMPVSSIFSGLFFSHKFSAPIDMHATYLSLYCALSMVTIISFLFTKPGTLIQKLMASAAACILSIGLIQLGSRAVIISLLAVILFIVPSFIVQQRVRRNFIAITLLIVGIIASGIIISDGLNYRFIKSLKTDLSIDQQNLTISDPRAQRWELAWQLVKERPLTGYGTGDEVPLLKEKYFEKKFYDSYLHELNAHNQYLSFLIKGGLLALLVYLFTLAYFFRLALKTRNLYFASFLLLVIITGLSENLLNVNKGIFFYAFFLSFFAAGELKIIQKQQLQLQPGNPGKQKNVFTSKELTI